MEAFSIKQSIKTLQVEFVTYFYTQVFALLRDNVKVIHHCEDIQDYLGETSYGRQNQI